MSNVCLVSPGLTDPEQAEYRKHICAPGPQAGAGSPLVAHPHLLTAPGGDLVPALWGLLSLPGLWRSLETHHNVMWLDESSLCTWEIVCQNSGLSSHPHLPSHTRRPETIMNLHRSHMPGRLCSREVSDGSDWKASCNFGREPGHGSASVLWE